MVTFHIAINSKGDYSVISNGRSLEHRMNIQSIRFILNNAISRTGKKKESNKRIIFVPIFRKIMKLKYSYILYAYENLESFIFFLCLRNNLKNRNKKYNQLAITLITEKTFFFIA